MVGHSYPLVFHTYGLCVSTGLCFDTEKESMICFAISYLFRFVSLVMKKKKCLAEFFHANFWCVF